MFAVDPELETQRNFEYNVSYQREIGFDTAIEFRYVGGYSNNLHKAIDFNQVNLNNGGFLTDFLTARNNCRIAIAANNAVAANTPRFLDGGCSTAEFRGTAGLPGQVTPGGTINGLLGASVVRTRLQQGAPAELAVVYIVNGLDGFGGTNFRANQNAGVVDLLTNIASYNYNAVQFEVRRRFTDGLQFQGNYTFQKTLTDGGDDSQSRFTPFLDFNNQGLDRQRADFDRAHTININANYELPFGKGKAFFNQGGLVDKLLGGWQLTTIVNISSGAPLSIKDINGTLNRNGGGRTSRQTANSSLTEDQIRDLVGLNFAPDGRIYFIDPSVIGPNGSATNGNVEATADGRFPGQVFFRVQPGQTGTLRRAFLNGPWYYNTDVGLIKNIKLGEKYRIQFRAEAFNVFNKTNFFIGEDSNIFDVDDSVGTTFGEIPVTSTFAPRIMQFAFRFEF